MFLVLTAPRSFTLHKILKKDVSNPILSLSLRLFSKIRVLLWMAYVWQHLRIVTGVLKVEVKEYIFELDFSVFQKKPSIKC